MNWIALLLFSAIAAFGPFPVFASDFSTLGLGNSFSNPSDDPKDWMVEDTNYTVEVSKPFWLPKDSKDLTSNNNVAIEFFAGRLFVAYRSAASHFASDDVHLYVISTADGKKWDLEWQSTDKRDHREPQLLRWKNDLYFYFFQGGTSPLKFEPQGGFMIKRLAQAKWTRPEQFMSKDEVPWDIKVRNNLIWLSTYKGNHYQITGGPAKVELSLKTGSDGKTFVQQSKTHGGSSEFGFEFDENNNVWGISRNEDGDENGFGSYFISLGHGVWDMKPSPEAFHSPKMFRHGKDLYLIARRNLGSAPYDWITSGGFAVRRMMNWARFSLTPKTTALFKLDLAKRALVHLTDLPGAGDTAFPSIRRVDAHTFLFANYTSSLDHPDQSWIRGQFSETSLYLATIKFKPVMKP